MAIPDPGTRMIPAAIVLFHLAVALGIYLVVPGCARF
jgi:hypothetical protein